MKCEPAIVMLSGGQDSATCLAIAKTECSDVQAIGFFYGQRHAVELEHAAALARRAQVPFDIIDLSFMSKITANALTRPDMPISHNKSDSVPNTFVEGRNHIFLSVAAIIAKARQVRIIYGGMCQTDFSGYPDCRDEFVKAANQALNLAMDYPFEIRTPLMWLTKAETVQKMAGLGCLAWYGDTLTCYEGKEPACGVCPSCLLRLKGFQDAGYPDPIPYTQF